MRAREEHEIPTEAGLAVLRGFIKEIPGDRLFVPIEEYELWYGYSHIALNGLQIHFETMNDSVDNLSLLDYPERAITSGNGSTLHKGRRTTNGLAMEEWIIKGEVLGDEGKGYKFLLTVNEKISNNVNPRFKITMSYRLPKKNSTEQPLTEAELMTIWQQITTTLHLRPGAISPVLTVSKIGKNHAQ